MYPSSPPTLLCFPSRIRQGTTWYCKKNPGPGSGLPPLPHLSNGVMKNWDNMNEFQRQESIWSRGWIQIMAPPLPCWVTVGSYCTSLGFTPLLREGDNNCMHVRAPGIVLLTCSVTSDKVALLVLNCQAIITFSVCLPHVQHRGEGFVCTISWDAHDNPPPGVPTIVIPWCS